MKKFFLAGTALMLTLCMMLSSALALDATILRVDAEEAEANGFYPNIREIITVGDTVYLCGTLTDNSYAPEILRWQKGMEAPETYVSGLLYVRYFDSLTEAQGIIEAREMDVADPEHGITRIFSDGERILALNHLNGKIFAIKAQDGKPVYEDVATIQDTSMFFHQSEEYRYFISPENMLCAGGKVFWQYSDWNEQTGENIRAVVSIDLKDGRVSTVPIDEVRSIAVYKDGKLLVLTRNPENEWDDVKQAYRPMNMHLYDPATDKVENIGEFSYPSWRPEYLLYSEALDALIYDNGTRIMGLFNNFKEEKQVGYLPMGYVNACVIQDDTIIVCGNSDSGVLARTLSKDFKTDEYVNVYGGYMDSASRAFAEDYPQIPVYSVNAGSEDAVSIDLLMNAGADAPDIMQLQVSTSVYNRLAAKGYCADLSGYPKLAAFVNDLYPVYRDAVTGPNGEIFAIPTYAYSYDGFFINKTVMEEMELTVEDLPTNLVDLCAFITRWNKEYVEKYPNYNAIEYFSNYKENMFNLMFERYIAYCDANGLDIRFDTPVFREMIAALEAIESKELEESLKGTNPEQSEYRQPLFWRNNSVVGNWYAFGGNDVSSIFVPMGLTKDAGYRTGVHLSVMFLNPKSQHKEAAVRLMEYMIDGIDDMTSYVLMATRTEPLESKYFAEWLEREQKSLADLEAKLATAAEEEKADLQSMIADEKAYMERNMSRMQYNIGPEALKTYREVIMPYVYVRTPSFLDTSEDAVTGEFDSLKKQYLDGKINIDKFIRDADAKLMMMQSE